MSAMNINMNRRSFMKLGASAAALSLLGASAASLSGCGGSSSSSKESSGKESSDLSGVTLGMLNYEGWIGEDEVSGFKKETGCVVKEYATPDGGDSAWVNKITKGAGTYDLALAGIKVSTTLYDNNLLAPFDEDKVPNLANIPEKYRDAYPYGIPVEQGKVGFIYNKDQMPEPPKTWGALFEHAADYSGKIVFPNFDTDVIDAALMSLGLDINTEEVDDIEKAKKAVIAIKPHIKAFLDSGAAQAVADGSATIAIGYDYEYAATAPDADNIAWAVPEDGTFGYLDGWVPIASSENLDAVHEFMNFHLDKENYIDFIDTTAASWLMDDIAADLDEGIGDCEALDPEKSDVTYQKSVSKEITKKISAAFQEIQNA